MLLLQAAGAWAEYGGFDELPNRLSRGSRISGFDAGMAHATTCAMASSASGRGTFPPLLVFFCWGRHGAEHAARSQCPGCTEYPTQTRPGDITVGSLSHKTVLGLITPAYDKHRSSRAASHFPCQS